MHLEVNFLNSVILCCAAVQPTNWVTEVEKKFSQDFLHCFLNAKKPFRAERFMEICARNGKIQMWMTKIWESIYSHAT